MTSSRRQFTKKSVFRIVSAFSLILVLGLIYRSSSVPKNAPCSSSSDCYALLKEKASKSFYPTPPPLEQQKQQLEEQNAAFEAMYEDNTEKIQSEAMGVNVEDVPQLKEEVEEQEQEELTPENEEEYKMLTDNTLPRVKGAFVVLARNKELYALRSSMRYLEARFNHKYNYPWIFLNDEEFTEEFKDLTSMMTKAEVHYGKIPKEHWSYPSWINQTYAAECREAMHQKNIVYGGSESYRHMCRYQSGFFMMHPLLDNLDYYWRVEPGVKFSCEMDYDPFRVMQQRDLKYGFTIALREYRATIRTLWKTTVNFAKAFPQYIYPRSREDSLLGLISDDKGWSYNLCHFWSNFEIASVKFMRSEGYQAYFNYLDKAGGFFYERWGDAPVHSIAAALMLKRSDVHWFYDIGYKHDNFEHCPTEQKWLSNSKCYCNSQRSFDFNIGSCTPLFLKVMNKTASDFIITRPEPDVDLA